MKGLGLQTCATLGMLESHQAQALKDAGLDYYNHNLDTSPEFYGEVITTRDYQDRLDTLERVLAKRLYRAQDDPAPFVALMITSYTKLVIVFGLLRTAMGLQQTPPNMVLNATGKTSADTQTGTSIAMTLPAGAGVGTPSWSPSGKRFAFVVRSGLISCHVSPRLNDRSSTCAPV